MQHNHQLIQEHQSLISDLNSQIPELNQAAATINELTEMCKTDQLSVDEYIELLQDVRRKINIDQSMSELETLSKLNTAIHGLLTLASVA
jgi:flagellin-like hook-associated protein FlgL